MFEFLIHLVPTALVLGVLVFIHEFGHFLACRFAGVAVEKFSIGFGPELFSWQTKETRYTVSLIPFGGFVKPQGESYEEVEKRGTTDSRDYLSASVVNRFLIIAAGVIMNFVFAYVLFTVVFFVGRPVITATIGGFIQGYPAEASGLQIGDQVVSLNGVKVGDWQDLTMHILDTNGSTLHFNVKRKEAELQIAVVPQLEQGKDIFGQQKRVPRIGIKPSSEFKIERYGAVDSFKKAGELEFRLTALTYQALWKLVIGQLSFKAISGPIGIVSMAGSAAKMGLMSLVQFTAILSISLAVINSLPIPALDGGHLFFLLIEAIRRKRVSLAFQERVTQVGFYLLMALMVLVVFNDLVNVGVISKFKSIFIH